MRDDAKKKETVKMRSNGEHYQVIYHLVKSAMIDRTVGHDGFVIVYDLSTRVLIVSRLILKNIIKSVNLFTK